MHKNKTAMINFIKVDTLKSEVYIHIPRIVSIALEEKQQFRSQDQYYTQLCIKVEDGTCIYSLPNNDSDVVKKELQTIQQEINHYYTNNKN